MRFEKVALITAAASGDATIGLEGRVDYGAIGTITNLASRLCDEAAGGQILASQRVNTAVEGLVKAEAIGNLNLKGFHRPATVYNVLALAADAGSGRGAGPT